MRAPPQALQGNTHQTGSATGGTSPWRSGSIHYTSHTMDTAVQRQVAYLQRGTLWQLASHGCLRHALCVALKCQTGAQLQPSQVRTYRPGVLFTLEGSYTRAQATTPPHHAINFLIHTTMQLCRLQARAENLLTDRTVRWIARLALQSLTETCSCQPPKQAQPQAGTRAPRSQHNS
jgi:hypothetical protein